MTPFPAKVRYYKMKRGSSVGVHETVQEAAVVVGCTSVGDEARLICVTARGLCVSLPPANVTPVISSRWRKMMAEVELSATGEGPEQHDCSTEAAKALMNEFIEETKKKFKATPYKTERRP